MRQFVGERSETFADSGSIPPLQQWQQLLADAITQIPRLDVARIHAMFQATARRVPMHMRSRHGQNRPQDPPALRGHPGQRRDPRRPDQTQQHGLRLILSSMGDEDVAGPDRRTLPFQHLVASFSEAGFVIAAGMHTIDRAPNAERLRELAHERRVRRRTRADAVIHVTDHHVWATKNLDTRVSEDNRVDPTRARDERAFDLGRLDRAANGSEQHAVRGPQG